MLFKKKQNIKPCSDARLLYFINRDSLTGQMNRAFAIKEFEKNKRNVGFGGVLVCAYGAENLPLCKGEEYIRETSDLIARIYTGEFSRIENGEFLIFTDNTHQLAEKIRFFLNSFNTEDKCLIAGALDFDKNEEDFDVFLRRIRRCTYAERYKLKHNAIY